MATLSNHTSTFTSTASESAPKSAPSPPPPPPPPHMKFRFKSKHASSPSLSHQSQPRSRSRSHSHSHSRSRARSRSRSPSHQHRRRHQHRHRHRHQRRDSTSFEPPPESPPLSPNTAFRESLFDALADDEGAAFWEGVYGQPIHTYSAYHEASGAPKGELERMTDEEYVAYVRAKMWERSYEFISQERLRRKRQAEDEKRRRKEEVGKKRDWDERVDEALKRREGRKDGHWRDCWERYLSGWRERVVWPVESGKREDVRKEEVEKFFQYAPFSKSSEGSRGEKVDDLGAVLKVERVRWHPDKVQQRFGSQGIDEATMKAVTAVFQVVDRMWAETRCK